MPAWPNLLVIGAAKCGTSSLHHYLSLHPEVFMSAQKELNFFVPEDAPRLGVLDRERSSWGHGAEWYRSRFEDAPVRGESSVAYSFPWLGGVAARIASCIDDPRLIYLVREPVARMLSHLDQYSARDRRSPADALADPASPYRRASCYATALAPYLEHFARERLLILRQEQLRNSRRETMRAIFEFLGVDPDFFDPGMEDERNVSAGKGRAYRLAERARAGPLAPLASSVPRSARLAAERVLRRTHRRAAAPLPEEVDARLRADLEPEIAQLETLTGWDLDEWRSGPQ